MKKLKEKHQRVLRDKGARNDGWRYETEVIALLASRWCNEKSIEDFWMVTSPLGVKSFDDIIAVVKNVDTSKYVYMGQLKSTEKKMNLKFDDTKAKRKPGGEPLYDIRLDKYLESYHDISSKKSMNDDLKDILQDIPKENYYFFFFTPMQATKELDQVSIKEINPVKHLDVLNSNKCFQWLRNVPKNYDHFFQNLYFFTEQDSCTTMFKALQDCIPGDRFTKSMIDILCDSIDDYMCDGPYCSALTKSLFFDKCVEVRLSLGMQMSPIEIMVEPGYLQLWDHIFSNYNVVPVDDTVLASIYSYFEFKISTLYDANFNWNECLKRGGEIDIKARTPALKEKVFHHLLDLLRYMGSQKEIPWLVREEQKKHLFNFKDTFRNGRFILAFNIMIPDGINVFYTANDLRHHPHTFNVIETIKLSLQGKSPRQLKEIVGTTTEVLKAVHPVHLLKWTSTDKQFNTIGKNLPIIDKDYIKRSFCSSNETTRISEQQLIANLKPQVLTVISSDPGWGKSTTLKALTLQTDPADYVLSWNLANSLADLDADDPHLCDDPLHYFFCKAEGGSVDQLAKAVFESHIISTRVTILIDSYDEMLPSYDEKILDVVEAILKRNIRTVISTRSHAEPLLMKRFPNMNLVYLEKLSRSDVDTYCKSYDISIDLPQDFLSVPLHLSMIRSVGRIKSIENLTRCELYEHFIIEKLNEYFCRNSIPKNRQKIQSKMFLRHHTQIALRHIFINDEALKGIVPNDKEWAEIVDDRSEYEAIGIVASLEKNQVQFTHQTFAEYLVATWICVHKTETKNFANTRIDDLKFFIYYKQTLKFLFEMNVNHWRSTFLSASFVDENGEIFNEDEWKLLPLHWGAINFYLYRDNADIFELLLVNTMKAVPDAIAFFDRYSSKKWYVSSKLWLSCACDVESDNPLQCLLETHRLNPNLEIAHCNLLHHCCKYQYRSKVSVLLKNGADPNAKDVDGKSGLHMACIEGNEDIFQLLLNYNANLNEVDISDMNILHYACLDRDNLNMVQALLKLGLDPNKPRFDGTTSLHIACGKGNEDIVDLLLAHNADPNVVNDEGDNALHYACRSIDNLDLVQLLLQQNLNINQVKNDRKTCLHLACSQGYKNTVQILLSKNADPNLIDTQGMNALHCACTHPNNLSIVQLLLQHKVNPNEKRNDGATSLHLACLQENNDVIRLLLTNNADPNLVDKQGMNALHYACENPYNLELVRLLLQHNLNPNQARNDGATSLHLSCRQGNKDIVQLLLDKNADPNAVDKQGMNVLGYVSDNPYNFDIVQLLTQQN